MKKLQAKLKGTKPYMPPQFRYEIEFRSRSSDLGIEHEWHTYANPTTKYGIEDGVVVKSNNREEIEASLVHMHNNSFGMIDHRIVEILNSSVGKWGI